MMKTKVTKYQHTKELLSNSLFGLLERSMLVLFFCFVFSLWIKFSLIVLLFRLVITVLVSRTLATCLLISLLSLILLHVVQLI